MPYFWLSFLFNHAASMQVMTYTFYRLELKSFESLKASFCKFPYKRHKRPVLQ